MTGTATPALPLPLLRRGKVREVYELDAEHLLLVASDRISAFDVVLREAIPGKGAVLTQLSAFWFEQLAEVFPSHFVTAEPDDIVETHHALRAHRRGLAGRAMLVRRAKPLAFECVVRGYLAGSAWQEYRTTGTLADVPLAPGLQESDRLDPPLFSPATKASEGHDENISIASMTHILGEELTARLRTASLALYHAGAERAARVGIIVADTKFEFGFDPDGRLLLIDELLTPDSSRFWSRASYQPGQSQAGYDKQPVRDYLAQLKADGTWNGQAPAPPLPDAVVDATAQRYHEIYDRLTGRALEDVG